MATFTQNTAYLIRNYPYQENHKIYSLLTRECGKISAIGYGAQKSVKRELKNIDYFRKLDITCSQKAETNLPIIKEVCVIKDTPSHEITLSKFYLYSFFLETIDKIIPPNFSIPNIFILLDHLIINTKGLRELPLLAIFLSKLIKITGHQPILTQCCQEASSENTLFFSYTSGMITCKKCHDGKKDCHNNLSAEAHNNLKIFFETPLNRLCLLNFEDKILGELIFLLFSFLGFLYPVNLENFTLLLSLKEFEILKLKKIRGLTE